MRQVATIITAILLNIAPFAKGADFSRADALFLLRGEGRPATQTARSAYEELLPSLTSPLDLVYAVTRIATLDIFEGEILLPRTARAERKPIFEKCFDHTALLIAPERIGATPQYYYWRTVCLALWGEAATPVQRALKVTLLKQLLRDGLASDTRFYGGGILRVAAGVYSNPEARTVGLYDPEDALRKTDGALTSPPYPGDGSDGSGYYSNYRYKILTLIELNRRPEAIALRQQVVAELEELVAAGALPVGREPETLSELARIRDLVIGQ